MIAHDIPQLAIELLDNGCLRLENTHCGETYAVDVHPCQLRLMAETMGLISEVSASDADILRTERGRLAEMTRDLDRLQRNILRVRERALSLQHGFANDADWQHADLTHEMGLINALVDLLDMGCSDFEHHFEKSDPAPFEPAAIAAADPVETHRVKPAAAGVVDSAAVAAQPSLL